MRADTALRPAQRGAVLVMALALLGLLAALAVLALQTAAMELQQAGSERARLRAFAAAELCAGQLTDALLQAPAGPLPGDVPQSAVPGMPGDRMQCQLREVGLDAVLALTGSGNTGRHYTLLASGSSDRGAAAALETGLLVVSDASGSVVRVARSYWLRLDAD